MDKLSEQEVKEFVSTTVWHEIVSAIQERIQENMKQFVGEYKIDKIRELQGGSKELLWVLALPRMMVEDIREDKARAEELAKIHADVEGEYNFEETKGDEQ